MPMLPPSDEAVRAMVDQAVRAAFGDVDGGIRGVSSSVTSLARAVAAVEDRIHTVDSDAASNTAAIAATSTQCATLHDSAASLRQGLDAALAVQRRHSQQLSRVHDHVASGVAAVADDVHGVAGEVQQLRSDVAALALAHTRDSRAARPSDVQRAHDAAVSHARDLVTTSVTVVATRVDSLQREQSQLQHAVHDVKAQLAAQSQPVLPPAAVDVELLQRAVERDASERQRHHADIVAVQAQLRALDTRVSEIPVRNSGGRCSVM
jgi:chromosome segregation ATPase